jgi:hypothetical protein
MTATIYPALFFSVVLLVTTAYFLMGGLPLLILKHDTSIDASSSAASSTSIARASSTPRSAHRSAMRCGGDSPSPSGRPRLRSGSRAAQTAQVRARREQFRLLQGADSMRVPTSG